MNDYKKARRTARRALMFIRYRLFAHADPCSFRNAVLLQIPDSVFQFRIIKIEIQNLPVVKQLQGTFLRHRDHGFQRDPVFWVSSVSISGTPSSERLRLTG